MQRPDPTFASPVHIVYNARSGRGGAEAAVALLEEACRAEGRRLHRYPIAGGRAPHDQARAAATRARGDGGIVAVSGGDGTINAVAQAALSQGRVLGVLPQGTFNYFARANSIPEEIVAAIDVLLNQDPQPVQVGLVNDRAFLVNASVGLYARLLEDRETVKSRFGRSRLMALVAALWTLMHPHRNWNLRLQWRGQQREAHASSLFVGNNALQFEQVGVADGQALSHGELVAVMVRPQGRLAQMRLLLRGGLGRLDHDDDVETMSFQSLVIEERHRKPRTVKVAADGEVTRMAMPLRFSLSKDPLWLIRPPARNSA